MDLFVQLMHGSETAFTQIYQRFHSILHSVVLRFIKDEEVAKDMLQQVFLSLWENRENLAPDTNLKNYLFTLTKNRIINYLRHENMALQRHYEWAQMRESDESWMEKMVKEGQLARLQELIDRLPEQQKRICLYKINDRMSNRQIAQEMGISIQTVKNQYSTTLKKLREEAFNEKNQIIRLSI